MSTDPNQAWVRDMLAPRRPMPQAALDFIFALAAEGGHWLSQGWWCEPCDATALRGKPCPDCGAHEVTP